MTTAYVVAMVLTLAHGLVFLAQERSFVAFPVQLRFAYLVVATPLCGVPAFSGITCISPPARRHSGVATTDVVVAALCRRVEGKVQARKRRHAGTAAWLHRML
jgi:hypothetical protein